MGGKNQIPSSFKNHCRKLCPLSTNMCQSQDQAEQCSGHTNRPGKPVKMQVPNQQVCAGAHESALLTGSLLCTGPRTACGWQGSEGNRSAPTSSPHGFSSPPAALRGPWRGTKHGERTKCSLRGVDTCPPGSEILSQPLAHTPHPPHPRQSIG